jgi:hypothetical protein
MVNAGQLKLLLDVAPYLHDIEICILSTRIDVLLRIAAH